MSKKICVVGTGYVGLIASVGLANFGNQVLGVDIDEAKVEMLKEGTSPIYEPGVEEYLRRNLEAGRLNFTTNLHTAISESDIVFIAVGTPPKENGEADLHFIFDVVDSIEKALNSYKVIVCKSTVPVGTNRSIKEYLETRNHRAGVDFDVVSNPEFLREGKATQDFFHPDRTVIGYESEKAKKEMEEVYRALNLISVPFVWCGLETAELIKYASNAFLATKITFINEMANLAEAVGADIHVVAKSMGMDGRISPKFLHPGPGYGGSCFPKDTQAIVQTAQKYSVDMSVIASVIKANEAQKRRMVIKLIRLLGLKDRSELKGKKIALFGLAFKQETDDIRDSPALTIVKELLDSGALVQAHDPKAMKNFKKVFPDVEMFNYSYDALKDTDCLILLTEWDEYRNLDLEKIKKLMNKPVILDTRNLLVPKELKDCGFFYEGVGRGEA